MQIYLLKGNYRPQRSCGQGNIFAPVCHSVHRGGVCLGACWDTTPPEQTPPRSRHPPKQTPPGSRHPPEADTPQADTPQSRPPQSRHTHPSPRADTPQADTPQSRPPPEADSGIQSMSGRYASYWNAFLLIIVFFLFCIGLV